MFSFISVDLQKDFSAPEGKHYRARPSVAFVKNTLVPYLRAKHITIGEIISDYRQPRPGDRDSSCNPGTEGYDSEIPDDIKYECAWVKCMNSPLWTRDGIGDPQKEAGLPYQDPAAFTEWINSTIGEPKNAGTVILFGLTADCCVFCTAQELRFRGYSVKVLEEATDTYSGDQQEKQHILRNPPLSNWAKAISWEELKKEL